MQTIEKKVVWYKNWDLIRLILAFVLTLPLVIEHLLMFFEVNHHAWSSQFEWYSLFATVIVQFGFGYQFYVWSFQEIFKYKKLGMCTLIALSTIISFVWSLWLFSYSRSGGMLDFNNDMHSDYMSFFEIGASIISFALMGEFITNNMQKTVKNDIQSLVKLQAQKAFLYDKKTKSSVEIDANTITKGQFIEIKNNSKISADGIIINASSYVNEVILTGEAKPVLKNVGDKVFAGTINLGNSIIIEATANNNETILSSIINKVEEIQSSKPKIQKFADKISVFFTPVLLVLAILAFIINFFFGYEIQNFLGTSNWSDIPHFVISGSENYITINLLSSIFFSIAMIAIACPCALGIATPLAVMIGLGIASKNHIIFNTKEIFEKIKNLNAVAFDKTGTLTHGKFSVINSTDTNNKYNDIIFSLEKQSIHPLANSLVTYLKEKDAKEISLIDYQEEVGFGLSARIENSIYTISGVNKLLNRGFTNRVESCNEEPGVVNLGLAKGNDIVAIISMKDELNANAKNVIEYLHKNNLETYLITGDNEMNAKYVANELGIKKYYSNVKPDGKGDIIDKIKKDGKLVAYVGDGINDLIALKKSDLAISISKTNESAKDVSDLNIVNGDIINIYKSLKITKLTRRAIIRNIFWAFGYNAITIPLAFLGIVPVILAPIVMGFSEITLILNTLYYKRKMNKQMQQLIKY
ncbi:MAG: heavy metal translocating P-type ATPase [Mycoplasma sp.]